MRKKATTLPSRPITVPWWALVCVFVGSLPIYWLFDRFGKPDLARPAGLSVIALVFAVAYKWSLRRRAWFWIAMTAMATLHFVIVLYVTWTSRWIPALVIMTIVYADFAIVVTTITFLENRMRADN